MNNHNKTLKIKIVTPENSVFSGQADMVVIPGREGEVGILPAHIPLITMLKNGLLRLYNKNVVSDEIVVSGGYAQVFNDDISIITEFSINLAEVNIEQIRHNIENLQEKLNKPQYDAKKSQILQDIERNRFILEFYSKKQK